MTSVEPIRWYHPEPAHGGTGPTLLWLHGGGFFRGGLDQPEAHDVARTLAHDGLTVATVDYRLAPFPLIGRPRGRVRFPLPLDDVLAAHRTVRAQSPGGVMIGGASAGACLAAAATLRATEEGTGPAGAVFAYGFFHATHPRTVDRRQRSRGHRRITHARWGLDLVNRNYAGSRAASSDRHAFPGGHPIRSFPRTLVVNAEHDTMRASGDRFADELEHAGVEVERHVLPGTSHAFLNRPASTEFTTATGLIAAWCRSTTPR